MFTGIIQELGKVAKATPSAGGMDLEIHCPKLRPGLHLGDSVSCNGACLTADALLDSGFRAHAVGETLLKTNLGRLRAGSRLNLEPSLTLQSLMGGHFVMGHVDGQATVSGFRELPDGSRELRVRLPREHMRYCIPKGSISLDGISLTIAAIEDPDQLRVAVIPHTLSATTLGRLNIDDSLNFETDMMGKYIERLIAARAADAGSLDAGSLERWGYGLR